MRKSRLLTIALVGLLVLLSVTDCRAQSDSSKRNRAMNRRAAPYTKRLPAVDQVELIRIDRISEGGDIVSIAETKFIKGRAARRIASVWRAQAWDYTESGDCHQPPFAIKFYARGKPLFYGSICWECHNILMLEPVVGSQGFPARSRLGQKLLSFFKTAFPEAGK